MGEEYRDQQRAEAAARRRAAAADRGEAARQEPPQDRTEQGPTESRGQIGRTNYYVRVDGWRNPALTTMVTAATEWQARAFRSLPRQAFLPNWRSATNISKMPRQLSLMCYAGSLPEQIYTVWVDEDDLLDAMDSEMDRDDRMRLLANMMSRGILEHGSGKWRAVP
jgi:hypothetical protein